MYFPEIPNSYIYSCKCLCWQDVAWGYEHKLVNWEFVVGMAEFRVSNGSTNNLEVDLICLGRGDIQEIEWKVSSLAEREQGFEGLDAKKKWLFIALKWSFENKSNIKDPLGVVELIYEDFDFPPEIESFVRYMPPSDGYKPEKHSFESNLERLFSNWAGYIDRTCEFLNSEGASI